MISIRNGKIATAIFLFIAACTINAANLRVSQAEGPYFKIMDAVNAAKPGDSVTIIDDEVYKEQVVIDSSKNGLVLRSENPTAKKRPVIMWTDSVAVLPKTCLDAQNEELVNSSENAGKYYDQNGAVKVLHARGVTIDGIIIDGGKIYPFINEGVWGPIGCAGRTFDLFHGNAAISLWISGDIIIRNCDMQNAYFGVNVKDRNIRGIFANPNPSDIARENIIPMSGFAKTGNHLFENNRFHHNSWGIFFESAWDLGSVIKYNLFYENHHQTAELAARIKGMGSEGQNQTGGAILFKDVPISPLAIYNNTFWHNTMHIAAQWQAGASHLVFNNIFGQPIALWGNQKHPLRVTDPGNTTMETVYLERLKHNTFASMEQIDSPNVYIGIQVNDPETGMNVQSTPQNVKVMLPVITNDLRSVETGAYFKVTLPYSSGDVDTVIYIKNNQTVSPGATILGSQTIRFPSDANNHWLEPMFKSTDPDDVNFLVPDWEDSVMFANIVDRGWEEAGIRDGDGSIADLGAIPYSGYQKGKFSIKPTTPVILNGKTATVSFNLYAISDEIKNPAIKYIRWLRDLPRDTVEGQNWGKQVNGGTILNVSRAGVVTTPAIPATPLKMGLNTLTFTVEQTGLYAFFEIIVEGKNSDGQTVTSSAGFLPYRKLENVFSVKLYPPGGEMNSSTEVTKVNVGEPYRLRIIPQDINGKTLSTGEVNETELSMVSPYPLLDPDGKPITITSVPLTGMEIPVMFTKIPEQGWDVISVNGVYRPAAGVAGRAIMGTSDQIDINPGLPAKILFQDPPSGSWSHIYQGTPFDVTVQVYDKYDNKVNTPAKVQFESLEPQTGDFVIKGQVDSDSNGVAVNKMNASDNAELGDSIPIVATLVDKDSKDNSKLVIGKPRNRYGIYYSDTVLYNPSTVIPENTCSGTRVPIQIRATTNNFDTLKDVSNEFTIEFNSSQLAAYASEADDDTVRITKSKLTNGIGKIFIQTTEPGASMRDASITISDVAGAVPKVQMKMRSGINFSSCVAVVKKAAYSANNGKGAVDQLDIYYAKELKETEIPDSVELFWPTKSDTRKIITRENMKLDPEDPTHVVVTLPEPFPEEITYSNVQDLGKTFWGKEIAELKISDNVGPLIKKAVIKERLQKGLTDTLIVEFSENVQSGKILGEALQLTKNGGILLNVLSVIADGNNYRIAIENRGEENSPKEGDSLKISVAESGESIIVDEKGSFAHKDNRPVELFIQEIPPEITFAAYYDRNADGSIDSIALAFNKKVKLDEQVYSVTLGSNIKIEDIQTSAASYINDSMMVGLNLTDKFLQAAYGKTGGYMSIFIDNKRYDKPVKSNVADSAAPVIMDTVWYYQGRLLEDETQASDTLRVQFSEDLKNKELESSTPLLFFTGNAQEYKVDLVKRGQNGTTYEFIVNKHTQDMLTSNVASATSGDRVNINVENGKSSFSDDAGNVQKNPDNRKALLMVKVQPVNLSFKIGPSPFEVNRENNLRIFVQPKTTGDKKVDMNVKVVILDNLGNCVYIDNRKLNSDEKVEIRWNGTNRKGRLVGTGTYALYIESMDNVAKTITKEKARKIAVKNIERSN